jgi:Ribonuclease G/E
VSTRILATSGPGEVRVAAVAPDDTLIDYAIWRPAAPDGVGDLHRGRVIARVPAMAGAFIALSDGTEGFLPDSQGAPGAGAGDAIGVLVTRAAQGGKGPRLTARLAAAEAALVGSGPPALLRRGPDAVRRLAALHPEAAVMVDDAGLAALLRPSLAGRVAVAASAWSETVAEQEAGLADTAALVAIDVDAGAATAGSAGPGSAGKALAQRELNSRLLAPLARQIRLRNLSGAILLDLAGMAARQRVALGPALAAALATDPLMPRFLGFTALGFAEITRPRAHPPLHEVLAGPHAAGLAALRGILLESSGRPGGGLVLRAAPAVAAALRADTDAMAALARRLARPISVTADASLPPLGWTLDDDPTR